MKHYTQTMHHLLKGFSLSAALVLCGALSSAPAQTQATDAQAAATKAKDAKPSATRSANVGGERDPFSKYRPQPKRPPKNVPLPVEPPSIQTRIERYKEQKAMAMRMQQPAPKPTTALLLNEMQVIGIFRTPRGYAAMVEATPIKLSYVIYPGERLFDGQLVAIEEDRLVFRRETRWTDGRIVRAVETKPLRQPNAVADSMATNKGQSGTAPSSAVPSGKAEEKASAPDKQ